MICKSWIYLIYIEKFNEKLEHISISIGNLTNIDNSSNPNGVVIFEECQRMEKHEKENYVGDKEGNTIKVF